MCVCVCDLACSHQMPCILEIGSVTQRKIFSSRDASGLGPPRKPGGGGRRLLLFSQGIFLGSLYFVFANLFSCYINLFPACSLQSPFPSRSPPGYLPCFLPCLLLLPHALSCSPPLRLRLLLNALLILQQYSSTKNRGTEFGSAALSAPIPLLYFLHLLMRRLHFLQFFQLPSFVLWDLKQTTKQLIGILLYTTDARHFSTRKTPLFIVRWWPNKDLVHDRLSCILKAGVFV